MQLAAWELEFKNRKPRATKIERLAKWNIQTRTAPGNHFVLSRVRKRIAGSPALVVFNTLHLITAFLHPRPREALLVPQHATLWMPRRHGTLCPLLPGRPFLSFVPGKLQFILQYTNYKSPTKEEVGASSSFFLHTLSIPQRCSIILPFNRVLILIRAVKSTFVRKT